jgi:hypothetical protein
MARKTYLYAISIAALLAAATMPGATAGAGDGGPAVRSAATAAPAPRLAVALRLAGVRMTHRNGRTLLHGVPVGRGSVRWLRPQRPMRRMRARRIATLWAGVQGRGSVRVRFGGRTVTLRRPRLAGGRFVARITGASRPLRRRVTLRATLRHQDRRIHDGCVLAPYARCAGRDFTLRDLHRADLRGADLRAARFNGAFLHGAALAGADLRGADLRGAALTGADLRGAKLAGADLADATLEQARVRPRQLRRASLCNTRLPDRSLRRDHCGRSGPRLQSRSLLALASSAAARKVKLTVAVSGPGSVTANRRTIRCPRKCKARYRRGAKVVLTAKPAGGATFARWSGRCQGKRRTCSVRLRRGSKVRATFKPAPPAPPRPPAPPAPAAGCPYAPTRDADDDGIFDCRELAGWTFNVHTPADLTRDGDGSSRSVTSEPGVADTDGDGVDDGDEYANNGDPRDIDTDSDGLDDETELVAYRSDLNHADTDGDARQAPGTPRSARLFDGNEVSDTHTNPRDPDTDGDSLTDYYEVIVGSTNARVPDLPKVELVAVPGESNVKIDLGYSVTETTGTEKESASSTQTSNGQTSSNGGSTETTHEISHEHKVGGGCHGGAGPEGPEAGCEVNYEYTNTQSDSFTRGSTWGFENSTETTRENQQAQTASAEHEVTFDPSGCLQVNLLLRNSGAVGVTVGDFQVLASIPDGPDSSQPLATLLPVSGDVYTEDCPATDSNFGDKTIPPHGSIEVGVSQQVEAATLREYIANPTPIKFVLGAISMKGTNLAGQAVNFLGDVATAVSEQTASVQVDFGDGTLTQFGVAAGTSFDRQGRPKGITLGEALGASLGSLSPRYTTSTPSDVLALTNPASGAEVANNPALHAFWSLVGDSEGIGANTTDWKDIVLRPGDAISLAYRRYSDSDLLDDATENEVGTDPRQPDTDGDGLADDVEVVQGWTVPLAHDNDAQYTVLPSPLSCDADGDGSADGAGLGNATYGLCPTGLGPESARAATSGGGGSLEGTDPALADTNADGLLDGRQVFPDVLKPVGDSGRVPVFLRQWGGTGDGSGRFKHAMGIAVDANGVDSYVIDRLGSTANDTVQKFTGNPLIEVPQYAGTLSADASALGPNGTRATIGATGIAVADGTVKTDAGPHSGVAGSPVVVNYYAKGGSAIIADPMDFLTTFNGTTGEDLGSFANNDGTGAIYYNLAFAYGGANGTFQSPFFGPIGNGHLDYTTGNNPIIGHGAGQDPNVSQALIRQPGALPTEYLRNEEQTTFGSKPASGSPTKGQVLDPSGVAVDRAAGKLYVADDRERLDGSGNLTRFDLASGEAEEYFGDSAALAGVHGVAVDPLSHYVYAAAGAYIYKLSPSLAIVARFGGPGSGGGAGNGALEAPWDLAIDANGGALVTDSETNLVQYFHFPFGP